MESWFLIRSIQTQQRWHTHFCVTAKLIPAARKTIFFLKDELRDFKARLLLCCIDGFVGGWWYTIII